MVRGCGCSGGVKSQGYKPNPHEHGCRCRRGAWLRRWEQFSSAVTLILVSAGGGAGVVRGCGRQKWAAATNLLVYWGLGIPLAVWLAFRLQAGVFGLWGALVIITVVQVPGPPVYCLCHLMEQARMH